MTLFSRQLTQNDGISALIDKNDAALKEVAKLAASNMDIKEKYTAHDQLKHKFGFYGFVVCECNGIEFIMFHLNDDVIAWQYFWLGAYESKLMNEFSSYLDNTDLFLDVGAYTGCYSLVAAKKDVDVNAFEMVPRTVERLKINVLANNVKDKVNIFDFGVSDSNRNVDISMPREANFLGTGNSVSEKSAVSTIAKTKCNVQKLDDWWKEAGSPDVQLIKLDVEEHEHEALVGMNDLVDQCRPNFLIEIAGHQKNDVTAYLEKYDYKITNIHGLNYIACAESVALSV